MRRLLIHLVVLLVLLLEGHNVLGFASAPGTYPEEETRAGNDMEVPKNPYESTWTGYDFYYEKEPKKVPPSAGSGKMPAFQSIASISTDRESPEDPGNSGYLASGAESGPKKTTSKPATTPTPEPTTTPVEEEKVKVSPSSSTKDPSKLHKTTKTPVTITNIISTTTAPPAPSRAPENDPESGSDQSESTDNLDLLYGGGSSATATGEDKKDPPKLHDPPPPHPSAPQNLLTQLIQKKKDAPNKGSSEKSSKWSDDHASGYPEGSAPSAEPSENQYEQDGSIPSSNDYKELTDVPGTKPSSSASRGSNMAGNPTAPLTTTQHTFAPNSTETSRSSTSRGKAPGTEPKSEARYSSQNPYSDNSSTQKPEYESGYPAVSGANSRAQIPNITDYTKPSAVSIEYASSSKERSDPPFSTPLTSNSQHVLTQPRPRDYEDGPQETTRTKASGTKSPNSLQAPQQTAAHLMKNARAPGPEPSLHSTTTHHVQTPIITIAPKFSEPSPYAENIMLTPKQAPGTEPRSNSQNPQTDRLASQSGYESGGPGRPQNVSIRHRENPKGSDAISRTAITPSKIDYFAPSSPTGPIGYERQVPSFKEGPDHQYTKYSTLNSPPAPSPQESSTITHHVSTSPDFLEPSSESSVLLPKQAPGTNPSTSNSPPGYSELIGPSGPGNGLPEAPSHAAQNIPRAHTFSESQGYEPMGNNGPSIFEGPGTESGYSEPKALSTASQKTKPDDKPYEIPRSIEPSNSKPYPSDSSWSDHDNAPGSEPSYIPDVLDYGARANNHAGKMMNMSHATSPSTGSPSNSNNAISARDPYDHFGTITAPSDIPRANSNFEEYPDDGGYDGTNDVAIVPLRTQHGTNPSTITTTNTQVRAQISEIDRIAESFENSAREPVEYEQRITSESSKGITAVTGKDFMKKLGRKSPTCCSCCDEKQSADPLHVQHAVDPSRQLVESEPVQNFVPLQNTVGGNAYIQPQPVAQQQTIYQQPFQQYQPQYPQSYQQPSCGCQPQPQNCCAPPAPCCLPTIPCCPPIPCCPQPKICCQPAPVCLPPPTCCSINFKLPTIPICGRACPSCPCRRRMHKSRRLKRHSINSNCHQCSSAGEPWRSVLHHREKRAAPGCTSGFSTMSQNSCGTCGASNLRSPRVKRMGCLPCLGRKKRDTDENSHIRVKRMGCLPCLGRKKRSTLSQSGCSQCNSMGHLFNRYKRSLFGGCSPCAPQQPCGCGRKKRSVTMKLVKRAPMQCDSTCCDFSRCPYRQKKEALVPFM